MTEPMSAKTRTRQALGAALVLLPLLALSIWKLPHGMATTDEALYLSIPYRLLQGDRPLLHEWHVTQLSSLLLLPLLRMYLLFTGGNTAGILLAFRCIHLLFHTLTTLYLWTRLKKVSPVGAVFAAAMYLVFTPINCPALSYNSMGIGLLSIALVTLALARGKVWEAWVCGLCFGGAVLCNPYYFILYPVYLAAVIVNVRRGGRRELRLSRRFCRIVTLAGAAVALAAGVRIFRGTDFSLLQETLPAILTGDTAEHPARSLPGILYGMWMGFGKNRLFVPTLGLSVLLCLGRVLDKNWRAHRAWYLLAAALLSLVYGLWFRVFLHMSLNFYMFSLNILGFFAWYYAEDRKKPLFFYLYLPGVLCWFCSAMASNLGFINFASVSTINMLASAVLIAEAARPLRRGEWQERLCAALMLLAMAVQLGLLCECRFTTVFPMDPVSADTAVIDRGALKGLCVKPGEKARYDRAWELTAPVREAEGETVAYFTEIPGEYLDDGKRCGLYSPWFPGVSVRENLPRLLRYWELFPDRVPDRIVIGMDDPAADELLLEALTGRLPEETQVLRVPLWEDA